MQGKWMNITNWSGDPDTTLQTFMSGLNPEIQYVINKLVEPINNAKAKHLVDIGSGSGSDEIRAIISSISTNAVETLERLVFTEGDRLTQSYA